MAFLDPQNDTVVIRVVYDGAPLSGKSTSVRALGRGLGASVVTPAEIDGRTLYFDWLDYTGGLFEGRRIRCQIVSVPGQTTFAPRRRRLLESSDVVVFVGDSSPEGFEADQGYLRGLSSVLSGLAGPTPGIVFQANKRDRPDSISLGQLRMMLERLGLRAAVVESVAIEGLGVREAFVFAVRLALDRVRELMRLGLLRTTPPPVEDAEDLLEQLRRGEEGALELAHTQLADLRPLNHVLSEVIQESAHSSNASSPLPKSREDHPPAIPNERVASGLIWPPVGGRAILHELQQADTVLSRSASGDWCCTMNDRWHVRSARDASYDDVEQGRAALVQSARVHTANGLGSTGDRCLALAADGRGQFRLWEISRLTAHA